MEWVHMAKGNVQLGGGGSSEHLNKP